MVKIEEKISKYLGEANKLNKNDLKDLRKEIINLVGKGNVDPIGKDNGFTFEYKKNKYMKVTLKASKYGSENVFLLSYPLLGSEQRQEFLDKDGVLEEIKKKIK